MDILNPMIYDVEEDKLREHTKYNQMDMPVPEEFQQQSVLTGISFTFFYSLNLSKQIDIVLGITLAIIRDGCACLAIIDHNSVEPIDVLGNDLLQVVDL
ncbi:unnamed protein product [Adineta steineri]|uniref:Uncharacterized protein n=1 Tax=Adineta steineri TaxID=433720 RepID=A0A814HXT7_9BILA|nr:unnamed protein product [Adineta steineri]CAF3796613.1 unnamed protein product [Adineta steineri]